ncbi:type II secretory pathway component PulM [Rhizobium sp. BK181]|nr:type II secretory pathway component PulM [Rhizobium sp. BK181]MCS3744249.1 type II secretory pathway component PulM [Rhizobium sp. BK661]
MTRSNGCGWKGWQRRESQADVLLRSYGQVETIRERHMLRPKLLILIMAIIFLLIVALALWW